MIEETVYFEELSYKNVQEEEEEEEQSEEVADSDECGYIPVQLESKSKKMDWNKED